MTHPYEKTIRETNAIIPKWATDYELGYIVIAPSKSPIKAASLQDAADQIYAWMGALEPIDGWIQYVSSVDYFIKGKREWELLADDTPLAAEFTFEGGSAVLRHIGGYEWGYTVYKFSKESDGAIPAVLEPNQVLAATGVFLKCKGATEATTPEFLNYTWLWSRDETTDALNRQINLFTGFDMGGKN